ncbi:MAG TPA: DUF5655 domain-containing protein [Thermoanaerobaculia bacterium]|nr:DUF5655 domain-containing protein [Thermoanaerobaculia bacterium]
MTSTKGRRLRALWRCAKCGRRFANRNQSHFCCSRRPLASHFAGKPAAVRSLFDRVRKAVESCGPATVLSEKTRIAFHARMSFMAVMVRSNGLRGHFVFATVHAHPRFVRVETISPRNHVHHFRLAGPEDVDAAFRSWVAEAYAVGKQEHLGSSGRA